MRPNTPEAVMDEIYERLRGADHYARPLDEYTHAEVLAAAVLLVREARQQVRFEQETIAGLLAERRPHLKAVA